MSMIRASRCLAGSLTALGAVLVSVAVVGSAAAQEGTPAEAIQTLPGFNIQRLISADKNVHGSWISMGLDGKGRLLLGGQRNQAMTRVTIKDGKVEKAEALKLPVTEAMGILWAFDSLYVNGARDNKFGLYRLRDANGDDQYDPSEVEFLREWKGGAGEHGAHGIVLGQDDKLYTVCGNFVDVPDDVLPSSPHRNYADDVALPRAEDGNGFGAGRKPPGGYVLRMDKDGKNAELFASGQRNTYDIAINADGEIFGFDSDMEWDWGTPWYRPVRVFQATSGADHGFREGTAKWPEYYFDGLPATVNVGIGSPTGVVFGYGAKFPAMYQRALYVLDWSYGRLIAVHLTSGRNDAGFQGVWQDFVFPRTLHEEGTKTPLNLTDAVIGPDGAMYFTVGGRNTQAALYRVSYEGTESTAPADARHDNGAEARKLRRALEQFHGKQSADAVKAAWPHLGSDDRFLAYAARLAVESQPVEQWKSQALAEKEPKAALTALLALARVGGNSALPALVEALGKFPTASLPEPQQLQKLRVIQVCIARNGAPTGEFARRIAEKLGPLYPAKTYAMNRELSQVLLAAEAPGAVEKTMKLLAAAPTQEEQIWYVHSLRTVKNGWTPELRRQYFAWWTKDRAKGHPPEVVQWFKDAGRPYADGASFPRFLGNFHADAVKTLPEYQKDELKEVLAAYTPPEDRRRNQPPPVKPRTVVVKEWKMADLLPSLDQASKGRSFRRGREAYLAAQCAACHKLGNDNATVAGDVGPDLTAVASRFTRRDILESIVEPSKVISEQYQNTGVRLKNGDTVVGRLLQETDAEIVLHPDQLKPEKVTVKKADVERRVPSKLSPMPEGLVNVLTQDEMLDMLAYIESGGRRDHPVFARPQ